MKGGLTMCELLRSDCLCWACCCVTTAVAMIGTTSNKGFRIQRLMKNHVAAAVVHRIFTSANLRVYLAATSLDATAQGAEDRLQGG